MKANEAPEKIFVKITHPISDEYTEMIAFEDGDGVEYTRTDVFIEKAVNFLNCSLSGIVAIKDGNITQGLLRTKSEFIEDFEKAMKL